MYADDICEICPISKFESDNSIELLLSEFYNIKMWSSSNNLLLNETKTKALCISKKCFDVYSPFPFPMVTEMKILGVTWCDSLSWSIHFRNVFKICSRRLYMIRILKRLLNHDDLWIVFNSVARSIVMYCSSLFGILNAEIVQKIERLFKRARKIICMPNCKCNNNAANFHQKRLLSFKTFFEKCQLTNHPLHSIVSHPRNGRLSVPYCRTTLRQNCYVIMSILVMNNLTDLTCAIPY